MTDSAAINDLKKELAALKRRIEQLEDAAQKDGELPELLSAKIETGRLIEELLVLPTLIDMNAAEPEALAHRITEVENMLLRGGDDDDVKRIRRYRDMLDQATYRD